MTASEQYKITLEVAVDMVFISPRYYHTKEASQVEAEIRAKFEAFQKWALEQIDCI